MKNSCYMKTTFILLLVILCLKGESQTWQWGRAEQVEGEGGTICTDALGNSYLTGTTSSPGVLGNTTLTSSVNGYLIKYSPSGAVSWQTTFNFNGANTGNSMGVATDNAGNVYITGSYTGTMVIGNSTYISTPGPANGAYFDMFLIKYDSSGNLIWVKTSNATFDEIGYSVVTDASGNVIVTGNYSSVNWVLGSDTLTNNTSYNKYFIIKYDATGNVLWATSNTAGPDCSSYNLSIDNNDNLFICGAYTNFLVITTTTLTSAGNNDKNYYLAKYSPAGNFVWAASGGGSMDDQAYCINPDPAGDVYVTGSYFSTNFTAGTLTIPNAGLADAFVAKYSTNGTLLWLKDIGSTGYEVGRAVAGYSGGFFAAGDVAPIGTTTLVIGTTSISPTSIYETWLAQFDATGNALYVTTNTGSGEGGAALFEPLGIALDNTCSLFLGGDIVSQASFPSFTITGVGFESPFMAKLSLSNPLAIAISGNLTVCSGGTTTLTASGAQTYAWTNGPSSNSFVITPASTGVYVVTGMSTGICSNTASVNVTVNALPVLSFTLNQNLYCKGQPVVIKAGGANTFSWSTGAQTPSISLTATNSTSYTLSGTNSLTGCSATAAVQVSVAICAGFSELTDPTLLIIYPNPSKGLVNIEHLGENTLFVYDFSGKPVKFTKYQVSEDACEINLLDATPGIYLLKMVDSRGNYLGGKKLTLIR